MARKTRRDQLAEQLTVKQQKAAYLLLDNEMLPYKERRKQEEIAAELEIDRVTLYRWRKENQAFIEFKKEVAKDYLGDEVGLFAQALITSMRGTNGAPSQKALDLYAKMMGFIKSEHSVEITQGGARTDEELAAELAELDAMLKEVDE
ncbi:phBC6A51 family helix-turn-helix protein [Sporosarcina sp. ITBMC105]